MDSNENVEVLKIAIDGQFHILLITKQNVKKDDPLCYNYNSGRIKYYPTNNFKVIN